MGKNDLSAAKEEGAVVVDKDLQTQDEDVTVDNDLVAKDDEGVKFDADLEADQNDVDANEAQNEPTARESKPTMGGNTDPADFSVFDSSGNFVEKRDR